METELFHAYGRIGRSQYSLITYLRTRLKEKVRNNVQAAEIWTQVDQEEIQQRALVNNVRYFRVRGRTFIDTLSDCEFAQSVPNAQFLLLSSAFTISQTMYGIPSKYGIQNLHYKLSSHFRAVLHLIITIPTFTSPKSKRSITSLGQHTDSFNRSHPDVFTKLIKIYISVKNTYLFTNSAYSDMFRL